MNKLKAKLKGSWRSFTIWFNGITGTVIVALPTAQDQFPQLQGYVSSDVYKWAMGAIVVANIALRFKTNADLADKGVTK